MQILRVLLVYIIHVKQASEPIKTIDCDRGGDQASPNERKFLVTDEFPGKYYGPKPLECVWTVQTSAGSKIQVKIDEIVPCKGGNHLIIKESGMVSKKICDKAPKQVITSTSEEMTFVLMVPKPGLKGVRAKIGFIQTGEPSGLTIPEFNKAGIKTAGKLPKKSPKKKAPAKKSPPKTKQGRLDVMNKKIEKMAKKGNVI